MTKSKLRKTSRARRRIEKFFLRVGILALVAWAAASVTPVIWQDWETWAFERQIRREPAGISEYLTQKKEQMALEVLTWCGYPPTLKPSLTPPPVVPETAHSPSVNNGVIGRLTIPRLDLSAIVREGTDEATLSLALGHIPRTALPGQKGNVGVAGHRDTLFRGLRDIRKKDLIQFDTPSGSYLYQVSTTEIVTPRNVEVLQGGQHPELTLITCYPFSYIGSAPDRFIVKAQLYRHPPDHQFSETRSPAAPAEETLEIAQKDSHPDREPASQSGDIDQSSIEVSVTKHELGVMKPVSTKISFTVIKNHSRELAPGISFGLTDTDVAGHRIDGWMWLMPDRRTIWLRDQSEQEPVVFYNARDGRRHQLQITSVNERSVTGYLLLPQE